VRVAADRDAAAEQVGGLFQVRAHFDEQVIDPLPVRRRCSGVGLPEKTRERADVCAQCRQLVGRRDQGGDGIGAVGRHGWRRHAVEQPGDVRAL
jgi:hypothetical protein